MKFHNCTRTKIRLSAIDNRSPSMFIIFDSRMIHSGAESLYVDHSQVSMDTRLFCHFELPRKDTTQKGHKGYADVDKQSCKPCEEFTGDKNRVNCKVCHKQYTKYKTNPKLEYFIDVEDVMKGKNKYQPGDKIVGDIHLMGWAVYSARDITHDTYLGVMNDVQKLTETANSNSKHSWKILDKENQGRFKNRVMKTYSDLHNKETKYTNNLSNYMIDTFQDFKKKNAWFEKYDVLNQAILCNVGYCREQVCHRDFNAALNNEVDGSVVQKESEVL